MKIERGFVGKKKKKKGRGSAGKEYENNEGMAMTQI